MLCTGRFFVLRDSELSIFANQDRADLSPAYEPSRVISLEPYAVRSVHEDVPLTLALQPKEAPPAAAEGAAAWGRRPSSLSW